MGTPAVSLRLPPLARSLVTARVAVPLGLGLLVAVSLLLRTHRLGVGFWIDEALSVGIADRPLGDIPGALRLDGSPPLYYLLLHGWLRLTGDRSEEMTRVLSLLFALGTIPIAWALVRSLAGSRVAWIAAALFAVNPFLTIYAQETRMYALVILLGTVACGCFTGAFVLGRGRAWHVGFAVSLVALLYTHNWALFLGTSAGAAWLLLVVRATGDERRSLLRRGALTFGGIGVAYAPWIPALLFQAAHTGAPWAKAPTVGTLLSGPGLLFGQPALAVIAFAGALAFGHLRRDPRGRQVVVLLGLAAGTALLAWATSQVSPAWAARYLAMTVAPLVPVEALVIDRAGRGGLAALVLVLFLSASTTPPDEKSNVREIAATVAPSLRAGDLVVSTQPEQAPTMAYYLHDVEGLKWATVFGPLTDLGVTDWRDGVEHLEATRPERELAPLLDALPGGARVVLLEPEIYDIGRWTAPWTSLVRVRSAEWRSWMLGDARFRVVASRPESFDPPAPNPVRATVFLKNGMG